MLPVKSSLLPTVSRFLDDDWNSLFDWSNRNYANHATTMPSVNIQETPSEFIVEVAAPGMKKEDFHIELQNSTLTIKSELKHEENDKEENYMRREFKYESFQRSFNFNKKMIDDSKIKAKYDNGILLLTLPKKEEIKEKPARLIKIS